LTTTSSASSFITTRRRVTVLLFTFTAGSVDAITYLRAHVFTANMTGNSVVLMLNIGQGRGVATASGLIALITFIAGVMLGAVLAGEAGDKVKTFLAVRREVVVEAGCLLVFAIACLHPPSPSFHRSVILVIASSGVAMGMQSAAVRRLSIPGVATTYITGTLTSLFAGLVHIWFTREQRAAWKISGQFASHAPSMRHSVGLQAQVYFSYALAALMSALLHNHWPFLTALLPLLAITGIGIYMLFARPAAQISAVSPGRDIRA
jgi:uncharacterized membrane protein YoaK (UPF0700 family)